MTTMATETATRQRARPPKRVKPIRAEITDAPRRPTPAARRIQAITPTEKIHRGNYQAIILVEFVAAILLTAATPIASKRNQTGLSPYAAADMVQLAALTLLYFILALVSVGGGTAARLSAWFGGLILVGVGLGEAASIAKTIDVFGTTAPSTSAGTGLASGSAGLINPNAPATSPAQPNPSPLTGPPTVGGIA